MIFSLKVKKPRKNNSEKKESDKCLPLKFLCFFCFSDSTMVNHIFNHHLWNIFFFQRPNSRKSKNLDPLCANQKLDPAKKIGLIRNPGIQVTERNHTVDGRNPVPVDVENMPFFHRVLYRYITGGAGFLPATVSCKMSLGCEMPLKKKPSVYEK